MIMLDSSFNIITANLAAANFFRKDFGALVNSPLVEICEETQMPLDMSVLEEMKEARTHVEHEKHIASLNIWMLSSADPIIDSSRNLSGAVLVIKDISEIKQMQESVREVKDAWEETFNTINDSITLHDRDFNILLCNKTATEMIGTPAPDIFRNKCFESFHGTTCAPDACPGIITLSTGKPSSVQMYEHHLNRFIEIRTLPRLDGGNRVAELIHVVRDITEQKKIDDMFKRTYEMTQNILEQAPFGIYLVNDKGRIDYVNPAMLQISGDSYHDFITTDICELSSYKNLRISEKIREALEGKPFFTGPIEYVSFHGKKKTVRNFSGIPLEEDITERHRAIEEQQHLQLQLFQA